MSSNSLFTAKDARNVCRLFTKRPKTVRKTNFSPLGLQRKLTVLSFRSTIELKAKICVKFSLREISNLVEFIGPRYSMAPCKSYTILTREVS